MKTTTVRALWVLALLTSALAAAAPPSREETLAAMKKATAFMTQRVALNGGYVWLVSEDLTRRFGEVPARPSQIWLQGGTEAVGAVMLDAYEVTRDPNYLDAARKAADAIVFGQLPRGGWHYFIDFDPAGIPEWYATSASRFRYGYEEYRHFYGNATFDDRVTADTARFLLRFYRATREAAYREPVLKAFDFVLAAQFPNGAWPQRFPLRNGFAHGGSPDYTSYYTLNDGAMLAIVQLLLDGYETLGDDRYLDAARRAADALLALQGPAGQSAWAEQHGADLRPSAARTHEPAGYVVRESIFSMRILGEIYLRTGDARYLASIGRCLEWFDRINREIAAERYPAPRYWEPGTNNPVYVVRTDRLDAEGHGLYVWTTDPAKARCEGEPCKRDGKPVVDVSPLRERYDAFGKLITPEARVAQLARMRALESRRRGAADVEKIIAALDARGAWVTDDNSVPVPNARPDAPERETVRGISTQVFLQNMQALIASLRAEP